MLMVLKIQAARKEIEKKEVSLQAIKAVCHSSSLQMIILCLPRALIGR